MVMHTVPSHLRGASLGEAHKWVREQMVQSNPSKPRADYQLTNESGKSVNLSDITSGKASHITINAAGSVIHNPAHPAEIRGFMELPKPMHKNRLTALTQGEITPALWHSMVNEYGLFGATQTLSILLTRPVSPALRYTQKTMDLIRARKGETLLPYHKFVRPTPAPTQTSGGGGGGGQQNQQGRNRNFRGRQNPRSNPTPAETRSASAALGLGGIQSASNTMQRAGILNIDNNKMTGNIRRQVDRVLDGAEVALQEDEHGALVSMANKMSLQYENSREIFDNFAKQVLAPYLITSTSNINALKYINEYILPKMREIAGNSDKNRRKLDRQYKHIVNKLATDAKDFYMGTEFALVAHPGFLFPRSGLVLMPVPKSTKDMAFRAFEQAGTPPTYDPATGFVATLGKSDKVGVAYIGKETFQGIRTKAFNDNKSWSTVAKVIDSLVSVVERVGEADSTGFNVVVRGAKSMAAMAGEELHKSISGKPAFFFVDLPGMRPIPTNWPQGLVMAMMETLAKGRDRITGLNSDFDSDDFLTPSGINLTESNTEFSSNYTTLADFTREMRDVNALPDATPANITAKVKRIKSVIKELIGALDDSIPFEIAPSGGFAAVKLDDDPVSSVQHDGAGGTEPWPNAVSYLQNLLDNGEDDAPMALAAGNNPVGQNPGLIPWMGTVVDIERWIQLAQFAGQLRPKILSITAQQKSAGPSAYQIMQDAVRLSITKYNYEPTKDDVYFTMILLYYSLRNMGLDAEVMTFMERTSELIAKAREESFDDFQTFLDARFPVVPAGMAPGALDPNMINNWLALQFAYEALSDPTSEGFRELTGVRVNPGVRLNAPTLVTDKGIESMRESIRASLDSYSQAVKATGNNTQAEGVVEALRTLVMPALLEQMKTGAPQSMFAYSGDRETTEEKLIEIVDDLYLQCHDAVREHIEHLDKLAELVSGTLASADRKLDLVQSLTEVKGSHNTLVMLDNTATMMEDFVKFMPKGTSKREKNYVKQMKNFMTILSDDLVFNEDLVSDLIKDIEDKYTDGDVPASIIKNLIEEATQLRDIVEAYDATVDEFGVYASSSGTALGKYPSSILPVANTPTGIKRALSNLHIELLTIIRQVASVANGHIINYAATKQDIPIRANANLFSDYMTNSKAKNDSINGLYLLNDNPRIDASMFDDLFVKSPRQGHLLFQLMKNQYDKSDAITSPADIDNRLRDLAERLVNVEYANYPKSEDLLIKGLRTYGQGMNFLAKSGVVGTAALATGTARLAIEGARAVPGALKGSGKALGGVLSAAGGTVLGTGLTIGGLTIGTGLAAAGLAIGGGAAVGAALISGGISVAGVAGSLGISGIVSSYAFFKTRRELREQLFSDPAVIQAYRNDLIAKKQEKETARRLASTRKEERALQLEVDMLDLGAQRLRLIAIQAKLEAKAAVSDAEAAEYRTQEAELNRVEESLKVKAMELTKQAIQIKSETRAIVRQSEITQAEIDASERLSQEIIDANERLAQEKFERIAGQQERALKLNEMGVDLQALKNTRTRFLSSFGNNRAAIEANKKRMTGELAQVYQSVSPAEYLRTLDGAIIDMERKLQGRI